MLIPTFYFSEDGDIHIHDMISSPRVYGRIGYLQAIAVPEVGVVMEPDCKRREMVLPVR